MAEFVLTSVDYELFIKLYSYSKIDIIDFRFCRAGYLSDTFRRFILQLYKDKTTLKNVDNMKDIYQNKKIMDELPENTIILRITPKDDGSRLIEIDNWQNGPVE